MIESDRLVAPEKNTTESSQDWAIRPKTFAEYRGQPQVSEQMTIFIEAARGRQESLDHTLIFGPPGLGKTTLANIIANEMGVQIKSTSGPVIEKKGDLVAALTNLEEGDVLFIDEIHRLPPAIEEVLYPAMEDFQVDITIDVHSGIDVHRSVELSCFQEQNLLLTVSSINLHVTIACLGNC